MPEATAPAPVELLGLCGSLNSGSSNRQLLLAAQRLAPDGCRVRLFDGVGLLPHYSPDLEFDPLPPSVRQLRASVERATGLIVCSPEYARGIPGAFKNALDWLVGGIEAHRKPVALWNASPRSFDAQRALRLVLQTLSCQLCDEASLSLPLRGRNLDSVGIAAEPGFAEAIRSALAAFGFAQLSLRRGQG